MKKLFRKLLFCISLFYLFNCATIDCRANDLRNLNQSVKTFVEKGDIVRNQYVDDPVLGLYLGNGRFGSVFGKLGLHVHPDQYQLNTNVPNTMVRHENYGNTQLMHIQHHIRGKFGADFVIPMAKIYWENEPDSILSYQQHQKMFDGVIQTEFTTAESQIKVITWFDPVDRDLFGLKIELNGEPLQIILDPLDDLHVHYKQNIKQTSEIQNENDRWSIALHCLNVNAILNLQSNMEIEKTVDNNLLFTVHEGSNTLLLSRNRPISKTLGKSYSQTMHWWNNTWDNTGYVDVDVPEVQKMWIRSMFQFFCTFNEDKLGLPPPCGFAGNTYPFSFPQDISYIHPMFLHTGHVSIAGAIVEYLAERLKGMKSYTKRFYQVDGVYCPWVMPYGDMAGFHDPDPPNIYYYEIHNSGYLARMAYETGIMVNDEAWTEKYVKPVIRETALFYKSIAQKEADGFWHLFVTPSMGQDERGGKDQKDYLCALYSAKYCFQKAVELDLDEDGVYEVILKDGLAFESLMSPMGLYYSCQGSGERDFGDQKHPVQLNPLAFLKVDRSPDPASVKAQQMRYDITTRANLPYFTGWTHGEFILASSRVGDTKGWMVDWDVQQISGIVDPEWIQIYECCSKKYTSYYTTTNGLVLQSILSNVVTDWWGKLEIGKCIPWDKPVIIKGIYTLSGVIVDGWIEGKQADVVLTAWKDCEFILDGEMVSMKKGEVKRVRLAL